MRNITMMTRTGSDMGTPCGIAVSEFVRSDVALPTPADLGGRFDATSVFGESDHRAFRGWIVTGIGSARIAPKSYPHIARSLASRPPI